MPRTVEIKTLPLSSIKSAKVTYFATYVYDSENRDSRVDFMAETGCVASTFFQLAFDEDSSILGVAIDFYADVVDRYGRQSPVRVYEYVMDRATFEKINWRMFTRARMCGFLMDERRLGTSPIAGCE